MGGKALNTNPTNRRNIEPTLKYLSPIVGVPFISEKDDKGNITRYGLEDLTLGSAGRTLDGSFGKKEMVGDIDVAIDENNYDYDKFLARLVEKLGPENIGKPMPGMRIIPTQVPVSGTGNEYVQVDFMFGSPDLLKWTFNSPDPASESEYKGSYRNILLNSLVQNMRRQVRDSESQEIVALVGPSFLRDRGIVQQWRHFPMRKDETGRVKTMRAISRQQFAENYPEHVGKEKEFTHNKPQEIIEYLFPNSGLKTEDLDSYEKMRDAIIRYRTNEAENIFNRFSSNLHREGLEVPPGLVVESVVKLETAKVLRETRQASLDMVAESLVRKNNFEEFRGKCLGMLGELNAFDHYTMPKATADLMPNEGLNYLINNCGLSKDWKDLNERDFGTDHHHKIAALERFYTDLLEMIGPAQFFFVTEHYGLKLTPESFMSSLIEMEYE